VENGGGMSLLADALGYAQLTQPVRFHAAWEQAASLRLRTGDTSVLAEYDQQGRIYGGEPEQGPSPHRGGRDRLLNLTASGTSVIVGAPGFRARVRRQRGRPANPGASCADVQGSDRRPGAAGRFR
jgi:hypothetical protein